MIAVSTMIAISYGASNALSLRLPFHAPIPIVDGVTVADDDERLYQARPVERKILPLRCCSRAYLLLESNLSEFNERGRYTDQKRAFTCHVHARGESNFHSMKKGAIKWNGFKNKRLWQRCPLVLMRLPIAGPYSLQTEIG